MLARLYVGEVLNDNIVVGDGVVVCACIDDGRNEESVVDVVSAVIVTMFRRMRRSVPVIFEMLPFRIESIFIMFFFRIEFIFVMYSVRIESVFVRFPVRVEVFDVFVLVDLDRFRRRFRCRLRRWFRFGGRFDDRFWSWFRFRRRFDDRFRSWFRSGGRFNDRFWFRGRSWLYVWFGA